MKRLIIGVDCDDVLVDCTYYIVKKYNELYSTNVHVENAHASDIAEWGIDDRAEIHRRIDAIQLSDEYAKLIPSDTVVAIVHQLAKQHELHLITARSEAIMDVTNRMLDSYFPGCFTTVEHVGRVRSKGDVCQSINADVLIDDHARHMHDAHEKGVQYLLWFGRYEWQDDQIVPDSAVRCGDWLDVHKEIDRIARK
ncbi:MAG: uncharacterized protein JWM07_127 [Candidatus Saccharibacteria bacterium]|nr:uncharacterized protein [Candidatus Saccharibacteria bacterium]